MRAVNAVKAADGSGSGLDADLLDGQHAYAFASSDHGHGNLPIAYGLIGYDGEYNGPSNVSSKWNGIFYEITVTNNSCNIVTCFTLVTPAFINTVARAGHAGSGKAKVTLYDIETGNVRQGDFYFVIYK